MVCGYFSPVDKNTAGCTFCGEKKVRQSSNMSDGLKHLITTHTTITHFLKVFFEDAKGYPSTGSTATSYYSYQTFIQLHLCRMCHVIRP